MYLVRGIYVCTTYCRMDRFISPPVDVSPLTPRHRRHCSFFGILCKSASWNFVARRRSLQLQGRPSASLGMSAVVSSTALSSSSPSSSLLSAKTNGNGNGVEARGPSLRRAQSQSLSVSVSHSFGLDFAGHATGSSPSPSPTAFPPSPATNAASLGSVEQPTTGRSRTGNGL